MNNCGNSDRVEGNASKKQQQMNEKYVDGCIGTMMRVR